MHLGKLLKGICKINDEVIAGIDIQRRELIKNNHSATHLLHSSLRSILGAHVAQKGSLVSFDKLRFDFSHNKPIENIDLIKIEDLVNKVINENYDIQYDMHRYAYKYFFDQMKIPNKPCLDRETGDYTLVRYLKNDNIDDLRINFDELIKNEKSATDIEKYLKRRQN